jgi:hypothetical protein
MPPLNSVCLLLILVFSLVPLSPEAASTQCPDQSATLTGIQVMEGITVNVSLSVSRLTSGSGHDGSWAIDDARVDAGFANLPMGDLALKNAPDKFQKGEPQVPGYFSFGGSHVGMLADYITLNNGKRSEAFTVTQGRIKSSISSFNGGYIKGDAMILPNFTLGQGTFRVSGPVINGAGSITLAVIEIHRIGFESKHRKRIIIRASATPAEQVKSITFDVPWAKSEPYIKVFETSEGLPKGTKDLKIEFSTIGRNNFFPSGSKNGVVHVSAKVNDCTLKTTKSYADLLISGHLGPAPRR